MLGPFRFTRGRVPGPGALEFAFQRPFYDPLVSPIGAGVAVGQMAITESGQVFVKHAVTTVDFGGTETGQIVSQPLLSNAGSGF
jgi:hypothetical protein